MARTTILEYLDNFREHSREVAYVHRRGYRTQRWTYGDVIANAHRFARELEARDIGKNDKVLIWGENCAEWIAVFFGCLLRGAIVVPIDKVAAPDFARRIAQQVDARLCVGSAQNQIPGVAWFHLETLREETAARSDSPVAPPELSRSGIVEIVFTSGTTAEPRGVVISHGNILANLEPLARANRVPFVHVPWDDRLRAEQHALRVLEEHEIDLCLPQRLRRRHEVEARP